MLDFRRGPKPRNFLSRGEQWRLLLLVLVLGLVVILAFEARKPGYYRWLWAEAATETGPAVGKRSEEEVDASRYFPGVQPSYLGSIRDNRPLGHSEWEAWLHLFDVLENNDEAALERASTGRASFVQLFEQSGEYRGELVTLRGIIRRAHPAKTPKNDYGLVDYYQTWLWPADHPNDPIAVWCLDLPEGFPIGMEMAEEAEVTGFSFKLWAYKAADGSVRRAPMVLARTVRWLKRGGGKGVWGQGKGTWGEARDMRNSPLTPYPSPFLLLLLIAGSALFAVLATVYVYRRTGRRDPFRVGALARQDPWRDVQTSPDVGTALKHLADGEDTRSR